jgi:hypothetical protein
VDQTDLGNIGINAVQINYADQTGPNRLENGRSVSPSINSIVHQREKWNVLVDKQQ